MKTQFTLAQLIEKEPCKTQFVRLIEHMGIKSRELKTQFMTTTHHVLKENAQLFSEEELNTIITAADVRKAASCEERAKQNIYFCIVNKLIESECVKIRWEKEE